MRYSDIKIHLSSDKGILGVSLINQRYNELNNLPEDHITFVSAYDILQNSFTFDTINYFVDDRLAFCKPIESSMFLMPIILDREYGNPDTSRIDSCVIMQYDFVFCPEGKISVDAFKTRNVVETEDLGYEVEDIFETKIITGKEFLYAKEHIDALKKIHAKSKELNVPADQALISRNYNKLQAITKSMRGIPNITLDTLEQLKQYLIACMSKHVLLLEYNDTKADQKKHSFMYDVVLNGKDQLSPIDIRSRAVRDIMSSRRYFDSQSQKDVYKRYQISSDSDNVEDKKIYGSMGCRLPIPYYANVMTADFSMQPLVLGMNGMSFDEDEMFDTIGDLADTADTLIEGIEETSEFGDTKLFGEFDITMSINDIEDDLDEVWNQPALDLNDYTKRPDFEKPLDPKRLESMGTTNKNEISAPLEFILGKTGRYFTVKDFKNMVRTPYYRDSFSVVDKSGLVMGSTSEMIAADDDMFQIWNKVPHYMQYFKYWDSETAAYQDDIMGCDKNNNIPLTISEMVWMNEMSILAINVIAAENSALNYIDAIELCKTKRPEALDSLIMEAIKSVLFTTRSYTGFVLKDSGELDDEGIPLFNIINPSMYIVDRDGSITSTGSGLPRANDKTLVNKLRDFADKNYYGPLTYPYILLKLLRDGKDLKPTILIMNRNEIPLSNLGSVKDAKSNFDLNYNTETHSVGIPEDIQYSKDAVIDMVITANDPNSTNMFAWPTVGKVCTMRPDVPIGFRIYYKPVLTKKEDIANTVIVKYEYVTIFELVRRLMSRGSDRIESVSGIAYRNGQFTAKSRSVACNCFTASIETSRDFQTRSYGSLTLKNFNRWSSSAKWKSATMMDSTMTYGLHHIVQSDYINQVVNIVSNALGLSAAGNPISNEFEFLAEILDEVKGNLSVYRKFADLGSADSVNKENPDEVSKAYEYLFKNQILARYVALMNTVYDKSIDPTLDMLKFMGAAASVYINFNKYLVGPIPPVEECIAKSSHWLRLTCWRDTQKLTVAHVGEAKINGNKLTIISVYLKQEEQFARAIGRRIKELTNIGKFSGAEAFAETDFINWYTEAIGSGLLDANNPNVVWATPNTRQQLDALFISAKDKQRR